MYKIEFNGPMLSLSPLNDAICESGYYKPAYDDMEDAVLCLKDAFSWLRDIYGGVAYGLLKLRPLELAFDGCWAEIVEL